MSQKRQRAGWFEAALWMVVVGCAAVALQGAVQANAAQRESLSVISESSAHTARSAGSGRVVGRLSIPAVALSVPLLGDDEKNALLAGVGHIPGTAQAGGLGNFGVAGHRDTYFRPLRRVGKGMTIEVATAEGTFQYALDSTEVVTPDKVDVLDTGERPEMTLVTCYPFEFIGSAPKRFIVHAHLVSVGGI